jgi:hypothetical protein
LYGQEEGIKQQVEGGSVDEEEALKVIKNQEFITMRVMEKIWPSLTITEDQL